MSSIALAAAITMVLGTIAGAFGLHALYIRANRAMNAQRNSTVSASALTLLPAAAKGDLEALGTLELRFRERVAATATLTAALDLAAGDPVLARSLSLQISRLGAFRELLSGLIAAPEPELRRLASETCETLRLRWMIGSLLVATEDKDPAVRVAACRAIALTDPELAVGVLVRRIDADDAWAGALLETTVKRLGPDALSALIARAGVGTPSPAVLRVLADSPSLESLPLIEKALLNDNANLRAQAARAIPRTSDPRVEGIVDTLMLDPVELVRLAAVHTMDADSAPGVLALVSALGDSSRVIRFAAATMLANNERGREALSRAAESSDPTVSEAAGAALWAVSDRATPNDTDAETIRAVDALDTTASGGATNSAIAEESVLAIADPNVRPTVDSTRDAQRTTSTQAQSVRTHSSSHSSSISQYKESPNEAASAPVSEAAELTTSSSVALLTRPKANADAASECHSPARESGSDSCSTNVPVARTRPSAVTRRTPARTTPSGPAPPAATR